MNEAAKSGVIIQECKTNGKVVREFVLIKKITREEAVKIWPEEC